MWQSDRGEWLTRDQLRRTRFSGFTASRSTLAWILLELHQEFDRPLNVALASKRNLTPWIVLHWHYEQCFSANTVWPNWNCPSYTYTSMKIVYCTGQTIKGVRQGHDNVTCQQSALSKRRNYSWICSLHASQILYMMHQLTFPVWVTEADAPFGLIISQAKTKLNYRIWTQRQPTYLIMAAMLNKLTRTRSFVYLGSLQSSNGY